MFWTLVGFIVLLVVMTGWVGTRALLARQHLMNAKNEVNQLRADVSAGEISGLPAGLLKVQSEARKAKDLTSDPVWSGLAALPVLGRTLSATKELAASVDQLAEQGLGPLIDTSRQLDPDKLRRPDGSIDTSLLTNAEPAIAKARSAMQTTIAKVKSLNVRGVLGPVNDARLQFANQLNGLFGTVDTAYRAAKIGPDMLGANRVRYYLMVFQTPAESRGTGGLVGSYAILRAFHGKLTRVHSGSNDELKDARLPVVNLGAEFNARYAKVFSAQAWKNANYTPNFPSAALIWEGLWKNQTGQTLDGVFSVDPLALGYLLDVAGSVTLSDGEVITGQNAATWSMVTEYAKYGNDRELRQKLSTELAEKTLDRLTAGDGSPVALLKAMGKAAGQRRLLAWAVRPNEEAYISGTPLAGELPDQPGPFTALVVRNGSGDKLDYYVERKLDYKVLSCSTQGRIVQITATLLNTAPASGLPEYVTTRSDGRKVPVGQDRLITDIYAARGSKLKSVALSGTTVKSIVQATEKGLPVYEADLELPIGKPVIMQVVVTEPPSKAPLRYFVQPLAKPLALTTSPSCP
jgi:hypothetical protein